MTMYKYPRHGYQLSAWFNFLLQGALLISVVLLLFPGQFNADITGESRLLLIICAGGMLGSTIRYSGILLAGFNLKKRSTPVNEFIWRMLTGIPLTLMGYFLVRGVLLNSNIPSTVFNIYGLLVCSIVVGFFSFESLKKLTAGLQYLLERDDAIQNRIEKISNALGVDVLDNYHGYFHYSVEPVYNDQPYNDPELFRFRLVCYFNPYPLNVPEDRRRMTEIEINGGNEADFATFTIIPRVNGLKVVPSEVVVAAYTREPSRPIEFNIDLRSPELPDMWIEVSQKGRLIVVVSPN